MSAETWLRIGGLFLVCGLAGTFVRIAEREKLKEIKCVKQLLYSAVTMVLGAIIMLAATDQINRRVKKNVPAIRSLPGKNRVPKDKPVTNWLAEHPARLFILPSEKRGDIVMYTTFESKLKKASLI
ncbi:hypothetical protein EPO17_03580 [Patescibacteria group bacterium]|nr:MAG: hypothetical protein EPO17_03580 [Patescibacteria group bacterium]